MDHKAKLRPLYLAKILYEQTDETHSLSTNELMELLSARYGISSHRQTIKTEIALLREFGLDIQEIKSTQNRYTLCDRQFDTAELKLLIDAVESARFITSAKSRALSEKLSSLASQPVAATLRRNVRCERRIKPGNERVLLIVDAINEAINAKKKISFQYFRYNERKEQILRHGGSAYAVTPLHLVWNGDYYYMVAVRGPNRQLASFRVDRIARCPEILEEAGMDAPEDFDIDAFLNTTFRMFNSSHEQVTLRCDNSVMDAIIDRFGEDVPALPCDGASFRTVVTIAVSHIFYSWVFGFGGKVAIESPAFVRAEYESMLRAAMEAAAAQDAPAR